jgi:RNA polymerase sigma-70 factor, ECF subfamily
MGSSARKDVAATTARFRGDRDLVRRFVSGDVDALEEIYARYSGPVMVVAVSLLADRQLAEEAVEDTFVKAWHAASTLDIEQLGPWLHAIAVRSAANIARREQRQPPTDALTHATATIEGFDLTDTWDAWKVRRTLDHLTSDARALVRCHHYEGLSHSQIARREGLPIGTVKARLHRAYRQLATRLTHVER